MNAIGSYPVTVQFCAAGRLAVVSLTALPSSGFAASEVAVLSTVQVAHAQHPAVIQLGAGTYDISQDIGDVGFPDDPTGISITGPGSPVPVWSVPQVLTPYDAVAVFLVSVVHWRPVRRMAQDKAAAEFR